jgi:hypothetical protein
MKMRELIYIPVLHYGNESPEKAEFLPALWREIRNFLDEHYVRRIYMDGNPLEHEVTENNMHLMGFKDNEEDRTITRLLKLGATLMPTESRAAMQLTEKQAAEARPDAEPGELEIYHSDYAFNLLRKENPGQNEEIDFLEKLNSKPLVDSYELRDKVVAIMIEETLLPEESAVLLMDAARNPVPFLEHIEDLQIEECRTKLHPLLEAYKD